MDTGSGNSRSPWTTTPLRRFEPLAHDLTADVCVIGAGISGLSVAYRLARAGKSVVVLEDGAIGSGETSRTTAHLSNAFDDRYHVVARLHGPDAARLTAESHSAAIDEVERIVAEEAIACGFQRLDGYLFRPPGATLELLERELDACHAAGLAGVTWAERAPLDGFETGKCLRFPGQAQFHPMEYLRGLVQGIRKRGGEIFTETHAATVEGPKDGRPGRVGTGTDGPVVTASHIVVATNTPINDWVVLHTKQYPYRTYVIAAPVPFGTIATALYWDTLEPYHYVRLHREEEHDLLVVGGEDHKTGQKGEEDEPYLRLERWARQRFPSMGDLQYRWSGQVMEPVDALAFIGRNPGEQNVFVVTGDSGNGMTHGVIAGMLLHDLILGRENPWTELYDPSRKSLRSALGFVRENANAAAQYASWLTPGDVKSEEEIPLSCGAVIRDGMKKIAVYRDREGRLHRHTAVCPHLGAIVRWNAEEGTWDCPAHGSRFDAEGKVLNGPANGDLGPADDPKEQKFEEAS